MEFAELLGLAKHTAQKLSWSWDSRLEVILRFCWQSPKQNAFPKIARLDVQADALGYLERYLRRYYTAREQKLSLRIVGTTPDPAVDVILQSFSRLEELRTVSDHHRQSMAAENLLGELLERYLAARLEPEGWVWCAGHTVRSIDFLSLDLTAALQVKNRDNSENSSSMAIRRGTEIKKWFRIYAKTGRTNWENFPMARGLSEDDFHRYIENYAESLK